MLDYNKIKTYYDKYGKAYDAERLSPYYRVLKNLELSSFFRLLKKSKH